MPIAPIDPRKSLHELESTVNQLSFMTQHSERLLELLHVQIEQTYARAPKRVQGYKLNRDERRNPVASQRERLLEKSIWMQWKHGSVATHKKTFHPLCHRIQTFQMPLQGQRSDKRWGKIDLVGVSDVGLPVVLELKKETASDTPLRILVEGLAYAVAIRRAWNEGFLRNEWAECVTSQSRSYRDCYPLLTVPVIGIAPRIFWEHRIGVQGGRRKTNQVRKEAWKPFNDLCVACSEIGFPVTFLQFDADEPEANGLPLIRNVTTVQLPAS